MYPEILSIGPFAIRSYGLMLAIGFMSGILLAANRAKKAGENPDHIYNLSIWIVMSSLVGARLYYVVTHFHEFRVDESLSFIMKIFSTFKNMFWPVGSDGQVGISGLILYGGLIAATTVAAIYLKRFHLSVPKYMDLLAPSLGIGEFFTRLGCFFNGCCFGKPTEAWCGVMFPESSPAGYYYSGIHLHPAQIYNSIAGLMILILLLTIERYKKFNGFTALLYFILYAVGRFSLDFFRHYETRLRVFGMSQNQILSLIVFTICLTLMIVLQSRAGRSDSKLEI